MRQTSAPFALLLSLIIALSSVTMAAMGNGAAAEGSVLVTLCGSDAPVLVTVPGTPAPKDHAPCPDCLLHAGLGILTQAQPARVPQSRSQIVAAPYQARVVSQLLRLSARARGPPSLI